MIEPKHLLNYVIRPVLQDLGLHSENAERLVLGTACQESKCGQWLRQLGDGPALGIFQMEPATHDDIWKNFLQHRPMIADRLVNIWSSYSRPEIPAPIEMVHNLAYAAAMCRIHYLRFAEIIPDNLNGQAAFWKKFYNTYLGKGTIDQYIRNWHQFVGGELLV